MTWERLRILGYASALLLLGAVLIGLYGAFRTELEASQFIGFGGVDNARFRGMVTPPARIFYMARRGQFRSRLASMPAQAWVNGKMVFEWKILGAVLNL